MEKLRFAELGLSPEILKAVDKMGFEEASPIQTAAIPVILSGRDMVGQSSTGSGKTAAFAIPAVERIDPHVRQVQVLVLCPTRELAVQVAEEVAKVSFFKRGVHALPIFGGQSYDRQFRGLEAGAQIVIGTPGRVLDHMERGTLRLDALKLLILDEADRMLDMGFREDIERVLAGAPESRQLLFFSATMPPAISALIRRFARDPQLVRIEAHAQNAPQVDQVWFEVDRRSKLEALTRLIDIHDFRYGIIFCATKLMVDELDEHMHARGYAVDRLHGDITQAQRIRVMEKFRRRGFEFLIATDVAARGLDVDDLEVVFNFDLPNDAEDYTHRIGRTGRAGRTGKAFTFVSGRELYALQSMIRYGKLKIRRERIPSLDQVEEARENQFFERLRATLDDGKFRKQDRMLDRLLDQGYPSTDIASALIHLLQGGATPDAASGKSESAPAPASTAGRSAASAPPPTVAAKALPIAPPVVVRPEPRIAREAPEVPSVEHTDSETDTGPEPKAPRKAKPAFERPARTGRQKGFVPLFFNVGRKNLVEPADLVGKIAGVTRQPASIVGAIDIHQRHSIVDIAEPAVALVCAKLTGVRVKGQVLQVRPATEPAG
ncbi:MAG: DEAD/DEAH box helicase [Opitutaceae bacterium]|nr:DEAD/DEAH box helicase [Opitutaceae bacterium]